MSLRRLKIHKLRNLNAVSITASQTLNLIHGANASGKTSLLEAIHFLARGRSFRTHHVQHLIQRDADKFTVFAESVDSSGQVIPVGISRSRKSLDIRVAGENVNGISELAVHFPLLVINPDSHQLLEQGPRQRRQFLDWGVFHVEPRFYPLWLRYQRALRQRNAALRHHAHVSEATVWDRELISTGAEIDQLRQIYLDRLIPILPDFVEPLAGAGSLTLVYQRGWNKELSLADSLQQGLRRDRERGHTGQGPHRADLLFKLDGVPAQELVSRGQQKLLVSALRLAQASILGGLTGKRCLLLIDDLPAELDEQHRARLMALLAKLDAQLFITAIEPNLLPVESWPNRKMFHVERGTVSEMI